MGNIYIGIDPEPSGAFCIYYDKFLGSHDKSSIKLYTSKKNLRERVDQFRDLIIYPSENYKVIIEKVWIHPQQSAQSMTKFIKSYGIWLGIVRSFDLEYKEVAPQTWKNYFKLSKDKGLSYERAVQLISKVDPGALEYIKVSPSVPSKQVIDRCEALLMAYYGSKNWDTTKGD